MKVIGVGLNKTGTKTLRAYLTKMGLKHHTFDLSLFNEYRKGNFNVLFKVMDEFDSFEDWPWPLMYKEIDERYKDAKFILTTRKSPEIWYKSLCKMAVRMGPLSKFEKHIYGYSMPQGRKKEHLEYYNNYNQEVVDYFKDRPEKLLEISFDSGDNGDKIAEFLGLPKVKLSKPHRNNSPTVYSGENLLIAHLHRIKYQSVWYIQQYYKKARRFASTMFK